jgi:hypothetical protein
MEEYHEGVPAVQEFPYGFVGTFNKADQYPLKMTAGLLVQYLEV